MFRLQFSLRALLLLMAFVGVAIVMYRRPWTMTTKHPDRTITTTFHRSWNGTPVKHGSEVIRKFAEPNLEEENWFMEGEKRRHRWRKDGVVISDESLRDGMLDGPSIVGVGTSYMRGHYRQGKQDGDFHCREGDEILDMQFRNGVLHGRKCWSTASGRLLQSADYANGQLVRWNGQPIEAELRRCFPAASIDAETQQLLAEKITDDDPTPAWLPPNELLLYVGNPPRKAIVQWGYQPHLSRWTKPFPSKPVGEALLETALANHFTLAYRFQRIHIVPINPQEMDWQDRTGVSDIRFEPGSREERFWLGRGVIDPHYAKLTDSVLLGMFYAEAGPPIQLDTTAVDGVLKARVAVRFGVHIPPHQVPRIRRDLLGQYLDEMLFYCELSDNTVVIKPHPEAKGQQ